MREEGAWGRAGPYGSSGPHKMAGSARLHKGVAPNAGRSTWHITSHGVRCSNAASAHSSPLQGQQNLGWQEGAGRSRLRALLAIRLSGALMQARGRVPEAA